MGCLGKSFALVLVVFILATSFLFAANAEAGSVNLIWESTLDSYTASSPIVIDGSVYVNSGNAVYRINASTGGQIWRTFTDYDFDKWGFGVANGNVYIAGVDLSHYPSGLPSHYPSGAQGSVVCFNGSNGDKLWNYFSGTACTSIIADAGVVYVAGFSYSMQTDIETGFVSALDGSTGSIIWNYNGPEGTRFDYDSIFLENGILYALSNVRNNSTVYAFNADTGAQLWRHTTASSVKSLNADNRTVYIGEVNIKQFENSSSLIQGCVLALSILNGEKIWEQNLDRDYNYVGLPVMTDDVVCVFSENTIFALNKTDGGLIWNSTIASPIYGGKSFDLGNAIVVNKNLYVGSSKGAYCFNAQNGVLIWNFTTQDRIIFSGSSPVYANGQIYYGMNGNFYSLSATNGQMVWNCTLGFGLAGNLPTVVNNNVYVGSGYPNRQGHLICLFSSASLPAPSQPTSSAAVDLKQNIVLLIAIVIFLLLAISTLTLLFRSHRKTAKA